MITCYENARVFTGGVQAAECFVVGEDGCFAFVGSAKDAHTAYPRAQRVDLGGRFVCPGFNDTHLHLLDLGCALSQAQLQEHTDSLAHVLDAVRDFAAAHPDEPFICGRGWNHDFFTDERRYPTRDELDAACPDRPCLIFRACGHVAVANSRALALYGIDGQAPEVSGGLVATDSSGRPNGVLEENAISLVSRHIPTPDRAGIKARLLRAMQTVNGYGITSVHSDDLNALEVPFEEVIAAYRELESEGRMTVRVTQQARLHEPALLDRFLSAGYRTGWGDEWYRIGPLKLITDGSLGARTALLRAPYADAPGTSGIATFEPETLDALVLRAHSAGMQIAAHAIGDRAADLVLDAIERAQAACPRENARHGIVHAQVLDESQAARMGRMGMHAYIQPIFLDYDTQIVFPRLGERALHAYPAASLRGHGVTFSGGSDCPVEPANVLRGIQCAVTRMPVTHPADAPYLPQEALSLRDALLCFTAGGAYASFEEHSKGRIAPGMLADFTVLGIDPFETDPKWLHQIPICGVYVGGRQVH